MQVAGLPLLPRIGGMGEEIAELLGHLRRAVGIAGP
jgi:hypothetical protein